LRKYCRGPGWSIMLIVLMIYLALYLLIELCWRFIYKIYYKGRINRLLDGLSCKEDFLYMKEKDFTSVVALMLKRKGHKVETTDLCGEHSEGLIINDVMFAEIRKDSLSSLVEKESAMKLSQCMRASDIYRGMLITTGDYKSSTRLYCGRSVIECVNGDRLFEMCRDVQRVKALATAKVRE